MKYLVILPMILSFSLSTAFASGGPSFESLHNQSHNQKPVVTLPVVTLIDKSNIGNEKPRFCPRNKGTTVVLIPCWERITQLGRHGRQESFMF